MKKQTGIEWLEELIECGADLNQIKQLIPTAKKMDKPKRKNKTFTKKDMLYAFNSGRSRRWDTGVLYYNNFETWYKNNHGFKKGFKIK